MPTAFTYFRFSSGNQAKGSSIGRQEFMVSQWLKNNPDYKLGELSFIDQGRSGYSGAHLKYDLGKILKAIKSRDIQAGDTILVEAIDRIGRLPPADMFQLILSITGADVSIVTVEDGQIYSQHTLNNKPTSLYVLAGKVQQAHDYSKRLSERVRAGYKAKREKARTGEAVNRLTPYWLDSDGQLIPDRAEAVKECIGLYLKGHGPRKILEKLESKFPELKEKHPSTLMRWFRNHTLVGDWAVFKTEDKAENRRVKPSEIIPSVYPPLIDRATFHDLRQQLAHRSKVMSKAASYELSGLCVCGECGSSFHYRRRKHKDYVILYGTCSEYLKRGPSHCSNSKSWPYEVLLYIHDTTNDYHLQVASEIENSHAASKELVIKKRELDDLIEEKARILELLIKFTDDKKLEERYGQSIERENQLEIEIQAIENQDNSPILTSLFGDATNDSTMLNAILKEVGYRIIITGSVASVSVSTASLRYELLRRSQNYGCYIVHHQNLPEAMEGLGSVNPKDWDYDDRYLAINRNGLITEAPSDQELINKLKDLTSHNDIM